jgi:hypothetical protein
MGKWTVWVGGSEVVGWHLDKGEAEDITRVWKDKGYDDVVMEEIK